MTIQFSIRTIVVGIILVVVAAAMAMTTTEPFPCDAYLEGLTTNTVDDNANTDPRGMGCFFRQHIHEKTSASVTQEGRIQRDSDTLFWSLFGSAFAANPNTPYLYTTLPLFSFDAWWWPFGQQRKAFSFLPSPMWRILDREDAVVFLGRLPPETVYMGFTTFALWRPTFRFVFASLGESSNGLTLRYDPETRLFAYVICFAATTTQAGDDKPNSSSAYGAVMEALVATGLPEEAINVQALDPELLSSRWTYYELVLRIFHFQSQDEGNIYLQSNNHNHPFYYVSAAGNNPRRNNPSNNDDDDDNCDSSRGEQNSTVPKQWSVPSKPTGFKNPFHPKSINEKELLAPSFLHYGRQVLSDLDHIFSTGNKNQNEIRNSLETGTTDNSVVNNSNSNSNSSTYINYTNHSFGPLYVAEGTDCLRHDTECLGGCPDAAYFGLNVVDVGEKTKKHNTSSSSSSFFESLPSWPTLHELHVVTIVDHRALNNSVYGSLALLGSSSEILDPEHLTRNVRATSVGVTSVELFGGTGETNHKTDADVGNPGENTNKMPLSTTSVFAAWVFTQNPDHCRILSIATSSSSLLQHHHGYGCTVIDSSHLSSSNKYVTYLERIYLNPLTGTRPDYKNILPARLYRVFLEDPNKERNSNMNKKDVPSSLGNKSNEKEDTASKITNIHNDLPFSKIRLPPSQKVVSFDGDEPLRFLHIIKTGGESLENYIWKEPSLRIDYGACFAAAMKATNSSLISSASSSQHQQKTTTAAKTSFPFSNTTDAARGTVCNALATLTSSVLCGLNCECCASDLISSSNSNNKRKAFHGTMLRSPRAHVLSQFSHCHNSHHSSWRRILGDIPLYAAEGILRLTEEACRSSCDTEGDNDWFRSLQKRLDTDEREILPYYHHSNGLDTGGDDETDIFSSKSNSNHTNDKNDRVLVVSIHNTQSHALTCGKSKGSFGHHFRRIARRSAGDENDSANVNATIIDDYTPLLQDALKALDRFEWFGITELFMPSLCLLHYQSNGGTKQQLPPQCDCDSPAFVEHDQPGALGYWKETRSKKRSVDDLTDKMLQQIDDHTKVDGALYSQAVRIFLGKLKSVEEATGTSLLKCIQWGKFRAKTGYLTELWSTGPNGLLV